MSRKLTKALLDQFSQFVATSFGLNFAENRYPDLELNVLAVCRDFGFDEADTCLRWLQRAPLSQEQIEVLTVHLTIGETYFFREKAIIAVLENQLLPALITARRHSNRRLRIWSAGCATGEEAYSLAILLHKLLPDIDSWNLTILGTDINVNALRTARAGIYGDWSFRNAPSWLKGSYMQSSGPETYEVLPHIRERVEFSFHNLVEDPYPSIGNNTNAMDIILCCNVLMYFQTETVRQIAKKFYASLVEGGWLIVSAGEATHSLFEDFERIEFPSATLFRRQGESLKSLLNPYPGMTSEYGAQTMEPLDYVWDVNAGQVDKTPVDHSCDTLETVIPSPPPSYEDAFTHYSHGRYSDAAEMLESLHGSQALALKARLTANKGLLNEALSLCDQAIEGEKVNPRHHYLRASILQELGREDEAVESLKRTLFLDQDFVLAHLALGNLLQRQGKRQEAKHPLRVALSLLQKHPRDESFPDFDGMTAGRLMEVVIAAQQESKA
jgi:chemotaxis protein methyltransferase CheR